jgi:hypothetical protein
LPDIAIFRYVMGGGSNLLLFAKFLQRLNYFFADPKMKLFGVMLTTLVLMGALVGGVVGVLLPKISTGISLGVLMSLYFGVV